MSQKDFAQKLGVPVDIVNKYEIVSNQKVLIDVVKDGLSLGRPFRDSPQIDNYVKIHQNLEIGKFYNIHVTSSEEYDLTGKVV